MKDKFVGDKDGAGEAMIAGVDDNFSEEGKGAGESEASCEFSMGRDLCEACDPLDVVELPTSKNVKRKINFMGEKPKAFITQNKRRL
mmetsp:Transcript_28393/g.28694  ORF Transcript_28393/g.28694 Transcript_28393/m.28694 type:complete len:87 (-) Transcript_28393:112-372(-)